MDECITGWMDIWTNGLMNEVGGWRNGQIGRQIKGQ